MKSDAANDVLVGDFVSSQQFRILIILVTMVAILPFLLNLYKQYLAYLALGPGGTPATPMGFLRIKMFEKFAVLNPYEAPTVPPNLPRSHGYLGDLPRKEGVRPEVRGIAPHRQVTQRATMKTFESLASEIEITASNNVELELGTSCLEKHGTGLFSTSPAHHTKHKCKEEVCHVHFSDGSMHMTLHPVDVKVVLESCWGERHPLSRGGRFERFVPAGFVMVYAPRTEVEVQIVMRIVKAATRFVSGSDTKVEGRRGKDRE